MVAQEAEPKVITVVSRKNPTVKDEEREPAIGQVAFEKAKIRTPHEEPKPIYIASEHTERSTREEKRNTIKLEVRRKDENERFPEESSIPSKERGKIPTYEKEKGKCINFSP